MSWDILIQDLPHDVASVSEIAADFAPVPLGQRSDLIARISAFAPGVDFTDSSWGELVTSAYVIEFNMGSEETVDSIMLHVRGGGEAAGFVSQLIDRLGVRAIDCSAGEFFSSGVAKQSFDDWQAFRDGGITARGRNPQGGSRVAGYVLCALLGAPLAFLVVAFVFRSPGLGVAVGLTAAIIGLTFALSARNE